MRTVGRRALALCTVVAFLCSTQVPAAAQDSAQSDAKREQEKKEQEKKEQEKKEKDKTEAQQGTLATFEAEATTEKPDSLSEDSEEPSGWWMFFGELALYAFIGGAVGSWYRVSGTPVDEDFEAAWGRRQPGEPTIPYVGLNLSYQDVKSDVEAFDVNSEGGYGPFALHYRFTRFREKDPATDLDLSWLHGVIRMSYTRYVEVGFGFGAIFIEGAGSESGSSFTLPIRIEPSRYFGFEYQPTWGWVNGNTISDHDLAVRLGINYVSLRAGYRWTKTGGSTLKGPMFGLLFSL